MTGRGLVEAVERSESITFSVDTTSIDPAVFGLTSYESPTAIAPRMARSTAMQVPAVKRTRDLICGASGGLPLALEDPVRKPVPWSLFEQPQRGVPRSVTMTRLFEDLLFERVAWWREVETGYHSYPTFIEPVAPARVSVDKGRIWVDGVEVLDTSTMFRFDSPNDGLLIAGARAIRTCLLLDAAAATMADGVPPTDYFTPSENMDPLTTDEQIVEYLNNWQAARRARSTGYVPVALDYHVGGWSPKDLQLADARQHAVLEIARAAGVDPEELGVSTTSRTYSNQWERRKAFLDFTLGAYLTAVEDRLRMPDMTPRGYTARFDLDSFLRTDTKTRYETYKIGLEVGALDHAEVRAAEGKAPLGAPPALPAPTPGGNPE